MAHMIFLALAMILNNTFALHVNGSQATTNLPLLSAKNVLTPRKLASIDACVCAQCGGGEKWTSKWCSGDSFCDHRGGWVACHGNCRQCTKECKCRNGEPVTGSDCKKDGDHSCWECDEGYDEVWKDDKLQCSPPKTVEVNNQNTQNFDQSACQSNCQQNDNDVDQSTDVDWRDYSVTCKMYNSDVKYCEHRETNVRVFAWDASRDKNPTAESKACQEAVVKFETSSAINDCDQGSGLGPTTSGSYKMSVGAFVMVVGCGNWFCF